MASALKNTSTAFEASDKLVLVDGSIAEAAAAAKITEARLDESYTPIPLRHLASCQIEGSR